MKQQSAIQAKPGKGAPAMYPAARLQKPSIPHAPVLQAARAHYAMRAGLPTATAELYLNRYRNAWGAMTVAAKQAYDDAVRRRGRPAAGRPAIPLSELAVPLPLSRFLWPSVSTSPSSAPMFAASTSYLGSRSTSCANYRMSSSTQQQHSATWGYRGWHEL